MNTADKTLIIQLKARLFAVERTRDNLQAEVNELVRALDTALDLLDGVDENFSAEDRRRLEAARATAAEYDPVRS